MKKYYLQAGMDFKYFTGPDQAGLTQIKYYRAVNYQPVQTSTN
jgi:hypothetical protein